MPGATDAVIYNNLSTGLLSNWLSQAFSIKGLVVSNVSGSVSINSTSTLTFTNGINMSQAKGPLTIAAPVALGSIPTSPSRSWNVATGQTLTVSGPISGSAGLYKDDAGGLYLTGAYAGAFAATNLPSLGTNLYWDTSGLTNGTLAVANGTPSEPPSSSFSSFTQLPDGTCQMTFSGTPGSVYRLWASTNLAWSPIADTWSNLSRGTFSGVGVTFTDTETTSLGSRFYVTSVP